MKPFWFLAAVLALAAQAHSQPASDPVIQVDFSNPELSPPQWTLILHPDGSAHFRSQMGKTPKAGMDDIEAPNVDRDFQVSKEFAGRAFEIAEHRNWFDVPCESHLKVAFQGWKTLTYSGPSGHGSCTFNYSRDKDIQSLGESMQAVAQTILEGARLEVLLQHDRLGLDQEMEALTEEFQNGSAQQVGAIRDILERLAQDDEVLDRVRKRAQSLLARGPT